jgi:hypothetical protein
MARSSSSGQRCGWPMMGTMWVMFTMMEDPTDFAEGIKAFYSMDEI